MSGDAQAICRTADENERGQEPESWPTVSIVVPVRNEARFIRYTLDDLLMQDYPKDSVEILVVDGQSTDATPQIVAAYAAEHPHVRLLHNPRRLSSAGRNVGIRAARGEIVLVIDGHCQIRDCGHLRRLATAFAASSADCLGRPQPLDVTGASTIQQAIAAARSSPLGHHPDSFIYSATEQFVPAQSVAVAYRRAVFDKVGLFDESFDACEDVELNHRIDRAGLRCFFTTGIAVHYVPRGTLLGLFRQMVRYGRGRIRLLRKHKDTFSLPPFIPALFVAGLIVGLPLSFVARPLAVTYISVLLLYLFIVTVGSALAARSSGNLRTLPWLPLVFATVHIGSGTGLLLELCHIRAVRKQSAEGS